MKNLFLRMAAFLFVAAAAPFIHAQATVDWETTAKSLVRLEKLSCGLEEGIARQVEERGIASQDGREEIAVAAARSLHRATCVLHRRFFDGAEESEIEERILQMNKLSERLGEASAKIGLYGYLREKLAAFLNERDWLKKQYGLDAARPS